MTDPHPGDHPAGSRAGRLAEARKQLGIVLEDVDLEAEPELGEAVTDGVAAADRAYHIETDQDEVLQEARREASPTTEAENSGDH